MQALARNLQIAKQTLTLIPASLYTAESRHIAQVCRFLLTGYHF